VADLLTNFANAFQTTLSASMGTTALTATVTTTTGGPTSPCYLVIDPDVPAKREYILFNGTFTATTFVTSALGNRYLAGSGAGSGITHDAGAIVRSVPTSQAFTDLHDRVNAKPSLSSTTPANTGTAAIGVGTTAARADHIHANTFAAPAASAVGDVSSAGTGTDVARSSHVHAREAFATPSSTGTANAAGAATTLPRSDHVHAIGYAATTPSALGTAAAGAATNPARIDHVHPTTGLVDTTTTQAVDGTKTFSAKVVATLGYQAGITTLGTTGTINLDFAGADFRTQAALTGDIIYTASNYAAGRSITIRVTNGVTLRTLTFPAGWKFVGAKPTNIAASKVGVLTLTSFGTVEADVVAAWSVEA
jgi:hypothetical protein